MSSRPAIAFVLKGYPRLSEAFIANEIVALEGLGFDLRLVSLRHPTDHQRHPAHRAVRAPVLYLPEYLYREPIRVWRGWRASRRLAGYGRALGCWWRDLVRDPSPNRIRRFGQALVLARELAPEVRWLHAHFLHTPASVARYAAMMRDLPWSCSAHAKDVWTTPAWEKAEKLADCRWLVTCTDANARHLGGLAPDPERVELVYHGLDAARFSPFAGVRPRRDGRDPDQPVVVLSVGRMVEKKGYAGLMVALASLPGGLNWRFVHIGGGPLAQRLRRQARRMGIAKRITWLGPRPHDEVLAEYRAADVFVLNCRIARGGDRDGLPNVLMEAQSQGLACLSTHVSAVAELIQDGVTGLLVAPDDPPALAVALVRLIAEPELRRRLGEAGRDRVCRCFAFAAGIDRLAEKFDRALAELVR